MENFYELFGFLVTLKETTKIILTRNVKFTASIAVLTMLVPSIILWSLIIYVSQSPIANTTTTDSGVGPSQMAVILTLEIVFVLVYFTSSHLSGLATILVSANSYATGSHNLTAKGLSSSIKRTWRSTFWTSFRLSSRTSTHYLWAVIAWAVLLAIYYPNFITIVVAIVVGISVAIRHLYSSVVWALSTVVSVLEYSNIRTMEVEKAENLVKGGQHLHGFMLNLFVNLLALIILMGFWMVVGDKGSSLNVMIYGLFLLNFLSLFKMFILTAYTVFYFQCKKHHGEQIIGVVGDLEYSELPTTTASLGNDIP